MRIHQETNIMMIQSDTCTYLNLKGVGSSLTQSSPGFKLVDRLRQCPAEAAARRTVTAAAAALTDSARARDSDRDSQALRLYESGCQWQVTVTGIVTRTAAGAFPAH